VQIHNPRVARLALVRLRFMTGSGPLAQTP
jgi:hypothetical protein